MTEAQLELWRDNVSDLNQRKADVYDPSMLFAISSLPHLDVLDLGEFAVNQYFLDSLTASVCRHLRARLSIAHTNVRIPALAWPLETLSLGLSWDFETWYPSKGSNLDASPVLGPLLRKCSQSLQTLRINLQELHRKTTKPVSFTLDFPRLRSLKICCTLHPTALESLVTDRLTTLIVDYGVQTTRDYLDCRGQLRDLSLLVWDGFDIPDNASIQMLSDNQQITAFGIEYSQSAALIDRVLPVLANFSHLSSLSIIWEGTEVPESSLHMLACLVSLKNLHISAGNQAGWRHDWETSQDSMRSILSPLERLKSLLFTRDSYMRAQGSPGLQPGTDTDYYHMIGFSWSSHVTRMSRYVAAYSSVFSDLQFVFIGQIPFNVGSGSWIDGPRDEGFNAKNYSLGI